MRTSDGEHALSRGGLVFDLTVRPWIGVLTVDGEQEEVSLREVFARAGRLQRIVGDVPTQEFALLRLLLAIAHDALDGPADTDAWADLWADEDCFAPVAAYLDQHQQRFDLLHPRMPFFQTAGLRTARDEVFSLNRIVADVPNGEPFFTARMPSVDRLSFAEAARWVVHAHAYDTSGIKTGVAGDERAKGGKVYPLGVGWAGNLGGVFVEGATLRETLLLNLIAANEAGTAGGTDTVAEGGDRPAWRREPCGPGAAPVRQPAGVKDLYTWQTRRLRLHFDQDGVHGVVLGYGDPLASRNLHGSEPMTAWRRSQVQEKKLGVTPVYLPLEHDPARAVWRGLASLIAERPGTAQGAEAAARLRPGVLEWVARLVSEGELPRGFLIRTRVVGAVYGTQQSVIDEIVDDRLAMAVVLLHRQDRVFAQQAVDAVADVEHAVTALGDLATDLARASGAETDGPRAMARELGFAALDDPYRVWLMHLGERPDPYAARDEWRRDAHRTVDCLGRQLLVQASDAAWEGRVVATSKGSLWLNSSRAETWFSHRLGTALGWPGQGSDQDAGANPADGNAEPATASSLSTPEGTLS
ncbi:type I-E CRISPR-associated protein Cse1/CasA [Streptomyces olivaceoviridis]|uniref:type I-E CRISPR-associated protein Cse1/CasA n=1 Tax=Streptomyces olivaceoviridis TaxID=1921 RepID=UPI0036C63748